MVDSEILKVLQEQLELLLVLDGCSSCSDSNETAQGTDTMRDMSVIEMMTKAFRDAGTCISIGRRGCNCIS